MTLMLIAAVSVVFIISAFFAGVYVACAMLDKCCPHRYECEIEDAKLQEDPEMKLERLAYEKQVGMPASITHEERSALLSPPIAPEP